MVKTLLAKGADVNAKNNDGGTALIAAIASPYTGFTDNSKAIVELLLKSGADVNGKDRNEVILAGQVQAAGLDWTDVSKKLMENGWGSSQADYGFIDRFLPKLDLERDKQRIAEVFGADAPKILPLLQEAIEGRTALMWAKDLGAVEISDLLKQAGAEE